MHELPVILLGLGSVGRALIRQVVRNRGLHASEYGIILRVLAVTDRDGAVVSFDGRGISDAQLLDLITYKAGGGRLAELPSGGRQDDLAAVIDVAGQPGAIVVDCTATDETAPALLYALHKKYKVVLANKKPLTIDQEVYDRLTRAGATGDEPGTRQLGRTRWETTCGAALPVIVTLNRLLASGDNVRRIAGTFSGTLGYVMTGLEAGRPFSEVVREAHKLGYTEPDPRDDLGGIDVARKALILARGLGWRMGMVDVQVRSLYPAEMGRLSVAKFLEALPTLDTEFSDRVESAAAEGKVLRYVANIEDRKCRVGPTFVEAASPLGRLTGTDNLVEFYTEWYDPNPLVIQGRGAGADVTASGVLSDVVELGYTS